MHPSTVTVRMLFASKRNQEHVMRHHLLIQLLAVGMLVFGACSKSTPSAPAQAPAKAEAPAAAKAEAKPEAKPEAKTPEAAKAAPAGAAGKAPAKADESDMVPAAKAKPQVTKEECAKACAHATKLSMASMPPDATPDMKAAIEKALTESCPKDCLEKGTKKLIQCVLDAKNGMDLAANCQK